MVKGYFYNSVNGDKKYNAISVNESKRPFYKDGVFLGHLQVLEVAGEMKIKVNGGKIGYAWLNAHTIHNMEDLTLDISQASGTLPRIDRVVLRNDEILREPSIYILEGGYSSTPMPPELTNNENMQELGLAEIYIKAGAVEITQADITDTRADTSVCGFVASQIKEISFEEWAAQFNSYFTQKKDAFEKDYSSFLDEYNTYFTQKKEEFNADHNEFMEEYEALKDSFVIEKQAEMSEWFEHMKGQLSEDAAVNLQTQIDDITAQDAKEYKTYYDLSAIGLSDSEEYTCLDIAKAMSDYSRLCLSLFASTPITDLKVSGQLGMLIIDRHIESRIFATQYTTLAVQYAPKIYTRYIRANDNISGDWIERITSANAVNNLLATEEGNYLDATQGRILNEAITSLFIHRVNTVEVTDLAQGASKSIALNFTTPTNYKLVATTVSFMNSGWIEKNKFFYNQNPITVVVKNESGNTYNVVAVDCLFMKK